MLQIITFVLVLALIYVIKAGAVMLSHEKLAANSAAFAWVHAEEGDEDPSSKLVFEENEAAATTPDARVASRPMRRLAA